MGVDSLQPTAEDMTVSHYDYESSKVIAASAFPFYALIMAAMRQADSNNVVKLREAFPDVWDEFYARYKAPGGLLADDMTPAELEELETASRSIDLMEALKKSLAEPENG